ncbi:PTS mannose/fructose/sorbose/N-acetylgalactosamine transporter subunit IIC [Anaerorhabdus sp.]|jgi:mannose/fructose/N-acetylgalactosamine-specific phosphotransferase system component IIC|uniref:PTS mannose/fructose/sorbose/N-acetylgalactosamine transporter subunit IIC n=1 Tax=Anaerorhabdus sp. TaxID=1872524 RepID=UPI002FCA1007
MFIQALLIGIWATLNGGVFCEYLVWIVRGAPLLSGAITGLILGDWKTGALIGGTIQLLYMGQITVGGISSYDKCYAGIIATAVTIVSNQTPEIGITLAVSLGTIGLLASNATMTVNVMFVHMADKYIESGKTNMLWVYNWLLPNLFCGLVYGIPAFLAVYFGATYLEGFMNSLPLFINKALSTVGMVLPSLGIALMLKTVYKPKFIPFAMFGYLAVAYLHFDIIACTILGVACAVLYWTLNIEKLAEGGE